MCKLFWAAALAAALAFSAFAGPLYAFRPPVSVSVGTSATGLATNTRHAFVRVCNVDASKTLYWGFDPAVTTSSGLPLYAGDCLSFDSLVQGQLLYGVAVSGTIDARVTEAFQQ